eukprot:bmy_11397T0
MSMKEVDEQKLNVQNKSSSYFLESIPSNFKTAVCNILLCGLKIVQEHGHTGVVQAHLSAVLCHVLLERLLPLYTGECRGEMEFTEVESNMNDLVFEYHRKNKSIKANGKSNGINQADFTHLYFCLSEINCRDTITS